MKRIAFTLLAVIMLFTAIFPCTAFAEVPDFSTMTDEEIQEIIDAARNALVGRQFSENENTVLVDQDDVQVYLTGKYSIESYSSSGNVYLYLEAVVINNTNSKIGVYADMASVNGWDIDFTGTSDVSAGKKKKCDFELRISDADISSYEEVEDFEISMLVYDCDSYDTLFTADPVIVTFK